MVRYIKCPRCELNYIDGDKQEFCDVCIAEIKGNKLQFADLEDEELEEELEAEMAEICPVCGVNRLHYGETVCEECRQKPEYEDETDADPDKDEQWKNYLDEESEELTLNDEELDEELKEELEREEEEEEEEYEEDEFFDDELDSLDELEDDDFEDDEDDEDDDDLF